MVFPTLGAQPVPPPSRPLRCLASRRRAAPRAVPVPAVAVRTDEEHLPAGKTHAHGESERLFHPVSSPKSGRRTPGCERSFSLGVQFEWVWSSPVSTVGVRALFYWLTFSVTHLARRREFHAGCSADHPFRFPRISLTTDSQGRATAQSAAKPPLQTAHGLRARPPARHLLHRRRGSRRARTLFPSVRSERQGRHRGRPLRRPRTAPPGDSCTRLPSHPRPRATTALPALRTRARVATSTSRLSLVSIMTQPHCGIFKDMTHPREGEFSRA